MHDFFVSDIKLQAIYKVIHTSNYDGHISKYVCKIGSLIVFEKWTLTKNLTENLTDPDADTGVITIAQLFFFKKSS
jgi:hypothetical protein